MKKKLIEVIIECLKSENEDREYHNKTLIDIPFCICALEQHLDKDKYSNLLNDIAENEYCVSFDDDAENYYSLGEINVYFEDLNHTYTIEFEFDGRHWGYCQCSEGDEDYDSRYDCCGHGCDWNAPRFTISKLITLGSDSFDGDEHDFWDYKDKFNNITLENKKELERLSKIKRLQEEKERIEKELRKLKKVS